MYISYLAVTGLAAFANGYAACLNFLGAESVKLTADRVRVSREWMRPLGLLLAAGATGLLLGLDVAIVGKAAAICLVLYFVCAIGAHYRARDRGVGGAIAFLVMAAAALITNIGYHNHW